MPARVVERTHVGASLLRRGHVPGIESPDSLTSDARGIDRRVRRLLREEEESGEEGGHLSARRTPKVMARRSHPGSRERRQAGPGWRKMDMTVGLPLGRLSYGRLIKCDPQARAIRRWVREWPRCCF